MCVTLHVSVLLPCQVSPIPRFIVQFELIPLYQQERFMSSTPTFTFQLVIDARGNIYIHCE